MPNHASKKLNLTIDLADFSQAQFEKYQEFLLKSDAKTMAVKNGAVVKAAIDAGFLKGIELAEVPNKAPAAVAWATIRIHRHVVEVTTPPGDEDPETKN